MKYSEDDAVNQKEQLISIPRVSSQICLSSKATLLILLWSFLASTGFNFIGNPNAVLAIFPRLSPIFITMVHGFIAAVLILYPVGGFIGDVKCGRYNIVKKSLELLIIIPFLFFVYACLLLAVTFDGTATLVIIFRATLGLLFLSVFFGFIAFYANIIPFAMDQMHDSSAQEISTFIHWYIWTHYVALFLIELTMSVLYTSAASDRGAVLTESMITVIFLMSISILFLLIISIYLLHKRQAWFHIEFGRINPYKLVYQVTKFAFQHKIAVHRSAFTYSGDEWPSRLDLGKGKYGGPFTTEQVEDVKVFYRILGVLMSFGPVFCIDLAATYFVSMFSKHLSNTSYSYSFNTTDTSVSSVVEFINVILLDNGLLSSLLKIVSIPLYLCYRHRSHHPPPGILRRVELGIIMILVNLLLLLAVDIAAHTKNQDLTCMFTYTSTTHPPVLTPLQVTPVLIVQQILSAFSHLLLYIPYLEFICAQSPHSMKGVLVGLSYAINGVFRLVGTLLILPFSGLSLPSCGFGYYSMNVVIGVIAFVVFLWVGKQYRYRVRDEPSKERQYATLIL